MGHDYATQIDGTLVTTLGARKSRLLKYTGGYKRGTNLTVPHKHGELAILDKYFVGQDVILEVFFPGDAIDDLASGLSAVTKPFANQGLVEVRFDDPHRGNIRAFCELLAEPQPSQDRLTYYFQLHVPGAFWEDVTASNAVSANPPSVTTLGDRPIDDMILTAAGTGFLEHTDELGNLSRITIDAGAGGTTPYVVDVGAGTIKDSAATPVDKDEFLTVTQPWWMKFSPGVAQSFTSDVAWSVDWANKWA